jgi:predicted transposase YbfD/YdcC
MTLRHLRDEISIAWVWIARRIVDAGGHYVLNVKGNQSTLRDGIETFFAEFLDGKMPKVPVRRRHSTVKGHGCRESRWHYVCGVPRGLPDSDRWPGLKAIGMVISNTERERKECVSIRYYIMTKKMPVRKFAALVEGHWTIENDLHWQLDVVGCHDGRRGCGGPQRACWAAGDHSNSPFCTAGPSSSERYPHSGAVR